MRQEQLSSISHAQEKSHFKILEISEEDNNEQKDQNRKKSAVDNKLKNSFR